MIINIDIGQFLASKGHAIARQTPGDDLRRLIAALRPMTTTLPLLRVGGVGDGGYLIPDCLDGIAACFSPGVGPFSEFEADLAARGIPSFMIDGSVEGPRLESPLFHFERKFLADRNDAHNVRLEDWVAHCAPGAGIDLLLQMDIEGAEYPVILDTSRQTLRRFRVMAIEFHDLDRLLIGEAFPFYAQVFRKLTADFEIVHIHPNNYSGKIGRGDIEIPQVLEFTFLRRDVAAVTGRATTFPHPLDAPNLAGGPDLVLPPNWWA